MRKKDALRAFGSVKAVADALDITPAAVYQWKDLVPPFSAKKLAEIKPDALTFDAGLYRHSSALRQQIAAAIAESHPS
jgi:hypothetical protein